MVLCTVHKGEDVCMLKNLGDSLHFSVSYKSVTEKVCVLAVCADTSDA